MYRPVADADAGTAVDALVVEPREPEPEPEAFRRLAKGGIPKKAWQVHAFIDRSASSIARAQLLETRRSV